MRKCMERFTNLLRSKDTCIYVQTYEENEFIQDLARILVPSEVDSAEETTGQNEKHKKKDAIIYVYSRFEGLYRIDPFNPEDYKCRIYEKDVKNTNQLFKFIQSKGNMVSTEDTFDILCSNPSGEEESEDEESPTIAFVLKDMHMFFDKDTIRALRDIKESLEEPVYCPIIVTSPVVDIPVELEKLFTYFEYEQMTKQDVMELLYNQAVESGYTEEDISTFSEACVGLTYREIVRALSHSVAEKGYVDPEIIHAEKIQIVKKSNALDYLTPVQTLEDTGGYDNLKIWIKELKTAMTAEAQAFGITKPKGAMLVGLPGNGKTMTADIIANYLGVPLLKLDLAKIMGSFVGQSERQIANALRIIKACAPCVCLIDESEKLFSGYQSSGQCDSGTLSRVLAQLLNFLQEDNTGVITIMTSNNVFDLPPEMTRSGRLDAQWYFGFPDTDERKEILSIYLKKNNLTITDNIFNFIIRATKNYSGAEIKEVVKNLLIKSYFRQIQEGKKPERDITVEDVKNAIGAIVPIYQSSKEKIDMFMEVTKGRYRNASAEKGAA